MNATIRIDHIGVVVPARNEADYLPRCLRALARAREEVAVPSTVVLALDSCTDDSAAGIAALDLGFVVAPSAAGCVGGARRDGVDALFAATQHTAARSELWIANTDADTVVPPQWLRSHLDHAQAGAQLVAGTVEIDDWSPWPLDLPERYREQYRRGTANGHGHIHGANLGIRGDLYELAGGFEAVESGEDVRLVAKARAAGFPVTWAIDLPVCTSGRALGRAPHGFAGHLRSLEDRTSKPALRSVDPGP